MKAILLGICILFAGNLFSQSVIIRGKVIDKSTRQPVIAASVVLPNGTGTSSDASGDFQLTISRFPVTLTISHVSYGKMQVSLPADPKKQIIIELEELVSDIGEVEIAARKLRILTEKDDFTLQDFAFDWENLWLLGYLNNQATKGRLWLANWFGDTITSIPVQNPERLYADFWGNVHLVMRDSVYHVYGHVKELQVAYSYGRTAFFNALSEVKAAFGNNLVYQKFLPGQQGLHTYYYSGADQKPYFLNVTRDTMEEARVRDEFIYGPQMGLIFAAQSPVWKIRREAMQAMIENKRNQDQAINRHVDVPVFTLNDTLFLVDLYKDSINSYDQAGKYIGSVPIAFHRDSVLGDVNYKNLDYLVDPIGKRVYILERKATEWVLNHLNTATGLPDLTVPLTDFPGMSGITVFGQAVYFLYPEKKFPYYVRLYRYQL